MPVTSSELQAAHALCSDHREAILASDQAGCFNCQRRYPPSEIKEWVDDGQTAVCPCGIDAVIGSSQHALDDDFMLEMEHYFFHRCWRGAMDGKPRVIETVCLKEIYSRPPCRFRDAVYAEGAA